MNLYRICDRHYSFEEAMSGQGASLHGGLWNHRGHPVVYTSSSLINAVMQRMPNGIDLSLCLYLSLIHI